MAFVQNTATTNDGFGFASKVYDFFAGIQTAVRKQKVYADTYAELSSLTNRELADIGIGRSDIKAIALDQAGL